VADCVLASKLSVVQYCCDYEEKDQLTFRRSGGARILEQVGSTKGPKAVW